MQADTPIPRNLGRFYLGHNFIRYTSGNYKDGYNMFRFGYTFPTWRRITFGVNWGIRYHGQGGHDLGANVHYLQTPDIDLGTDYAIKTAQGFYGSYRGGNIVDGQVVYSVKNVHVEKTNAGTAYIGLIYIICSSKLMSMAFPTRKVIIIIFTFA